MLFFLVKVAYWAEEPGGTGAGEQAYVSSQDGIWPPCLMVQGISNER